MIVVAEIPHDGRMMVVTKTSVMAIRSVRIRVSVNRTKATVSQVTVTTTRSVLTRISVSAIKTSAAKTTAMTIGNDRIATSASLIGATVGRATALVGECHPGAPAKLLAPTLRAWPPDGLPP